MKLYLILLKSILAAAFEEIGSNLMKLFLFGAIAFYYGHTIINYPLAIIPLDIVSDEKYPLGASLWKLFSSADGYHFVGIIFILLYLFGLLFRASLPPQILTNFHPASKQKRYIIALIYEYWNMKCILFGIFMMAIYIGQSDEANFNAFSPLVLFVWFLIAVFLKRCLLKLLKFKLSKQKIALALFVFSLLPAAFYILLYFQLINILGFAFTSLFILIALDFILHDESLFLKNNSAVLIEIPFMQILLHNKKFLTVYVLSFFIFSLLGIGYIATFARELFFVSLFFISPIPLFTYWGANFWAFFPNYLFCLSVFSDGKKLMKTYFKIIGFSICLHFSIIVISLLSIKIFSLKEWIIFILFYFISALSMTLISLYGSIEFPKKIKNLLQFSGLIKFQVNILLVSSVVIIILLSISPIIFGVSVVLILIGAVFAIRNFESVYKKSKYKLFNTVFK